MLIKANTATGSCSPSEPLPVHTRPVGAKPFICTYCGIRLSTYSGSRAEFEGCPSCYRLNTIEMRT